MDISVSNETGKLKIDDSIFGDMAKRAIYTVNQEAWLATERGRILDDIGLFPSDYSQSFDIEYEEGKVKFTLFIVCAFGKSIKGISTRLLNQLEGELKKTFGEDLLELKVKVIGIKSKEIARRDIEFSRSYE